MQLHNVKFHQIQVNMCHLNPIQSDQYQIYLPGRDGQLSCLSGWLYTKMVYLSAESHPSKTATRLGVEPTIF